MFDVPQTLISSFEAVDMTLEEKYIGHFERAVRAKQHGAINFIWTLRALIGENVYLKNYLEISEYDSECKPVSDTELIYS